MAVSDAILQRLLALHPKIIDLELDRIERLLARLGHPERKLAPVIHVAGTNGKGSTIAFMRAMLEAAGLSVHVYTSPHLVRFHERIRLGRPGGGVLIAEAELCDLLAECERINGGEQITYFEITTAAAFLAFSRRRADYVLLETGLGGRVDATNVIERPALSVITPVCLDHQSYLGTTIAAIAGEKAGILKPGSPALIGPQTNEARAVMEHTARRVGAPVLLAGQHWQAFEQHGRLVYQDESRLLDLPLPQLVGRFQIDNAAMAVAAICALPGAPVDEDQMARGLKAAVWPARLQQLAPGRVRDLAGPGREIWLDGGHNRAAARALAQSLAELNDRLARPLALVCGMLNTKDVAAFLEPFCGLAGMVIAVTIPDEPGAVGGGRGGGVGREIGFKTRCARDIETAVIKAGGFAANGRILVCGSLYLSGHVLALNGAGDL